MIKVILWAAKQLLLYVAGLVYADMKDGKRIHDLISDLEAKHAAKKHGMNVYEVRKNNKEV